MFSKVRLQKVSNSAVHRLHFDSMKRVDQTYLPFSSLVTGKFRSPSAPLSGLPQLKKQTHPKSAKLSADDHSWSLASRWPSYRLWIHWYFAYVLFFFPDVEKKNPKTRHCSRRADPLKGYVVWERFMGVDGPDLQAPDKDTRWRHLTRRYQNAVKTRGWLSIINYIFHAA